jgi:hypothetical protein
MAPKDRKFFLPRVWGPPGWTYASFVAASYPDEPDEETRQKYKDFFVIFGETLPCGSCGQHFSVMTSAWGVAPLDAQALRGGDSLLKWLTTAHNAVNSRTSKPLVEWRAVNAAYNGIAGSCIDAACRDQVAHVQEYWGEPWHSKPRDIAPLAVAKPEMLTDALSFTKVNMLVMAGGIFLGIAVTAAVMKSKPPKTGFKPIRPVP